LIRKKTFGMEMIEEDTSVWQQHYNIDISTLMKKRFQALKEAHNNDSLLMQQKRDIIGRAKWTLRNLPLHCPPCVHVMRLAPDCYSLPRPLFAEDKVPLTTADTEYF